MGRGVSASAPSCTTDVVAAAEDGREVDGDGDGGLIAAASAATALNSPLFLLLVLFSRVSEYRRCVRQSGEMGAIVKKETAREKKKEISGDD